MKFLHLGDLHLGKSLGDFDLIRDQKYILDQILEIVKNQSVDAVLIAGEYTTEQFRVKRRQGCWITFCAVLRSPAL